VTFAGATQGGDVGQSDTPCPARRDARRPIAFVADAAKRDLEPAERKKSCAAKALYQHKHIEFHKSVKMSGARRFASEAPDAVSGDVLQRAGAGAST
jgi:hypothetical protein